MGKFETSREFDETYSFERFALNEAVPPAALKKGEFSKLAGVDGRIRGALRVFPGFTDGTFPFTLADLVMFKGFSVQKGNSDTVLHGLLVLYDSGSSVYKLELKYYDGSWKTYTINSNFTGSQDDVDITVAGKLVMVTGARVDTTTIVDIDASTGVTVTGTYTGEGAIVQYRVAVNVGASPDTFNAWFQQKQVRTNQAITASTAYLLAEGISVTFNTDEHAAATQFFILVKRGGAVTIFWDDDAADFTQEPSGSLFNDYPFGFLETNFQTTNQIPPGVLGPLSSAVNVCQQTVLNSFLQLRISDAGESGTTPFLSGDGGEYGIAWRLRDTRRNLYTALSIAPLGPLEATGTFCLKVFLAKNNWLTVRNVTTWDRLEIFRTIKTGSIMYKEWDVDLGAHTGNAAETLRDAFAIILTVGAESGYAAATDPTYTLEAYFTADLLGGISTIDTFPGESQAPHGVPDGALVNHTIWDIEYDSTHIMPPNANRIGSFQEITIVQHDGVGSEATNEVVQRTNTALLYSPLGFFRPEMFPSANVVPIPQKDGRVQQFQEAGDYMYAVTANAMWRLQRSGARLAANRINVGWGIANRDAMVEANNELYVALRRGLLKVYGPDATPILLVAVERKMLDDWKDELSSGPDTATPGDQPKIQTAFDAVLGAVFILNRIQKECIIVWTATGQITTLEDVPWDLVTTLPDPVNGGSVRAWFAKSSDNAMYRADPEQDETNGPTFITNQGTVQSTATGGSTTSLTDSAVVMSASLPGHIIYVDTGSGYEKATITSRSLNAVTFSGGLSGGGTVASGNRYILSPIRFNVVGSPIRGLDDEDQFHRRVIHGMWAQPHVVSGTPNAKARWTYETYLQSASTPTATKDATWDAAGDVPDQLAGYIPQSGTILRPGWLCIEPVMHYELLSGRVKGKLLTTDKVST